jgi:hypothetical protein
MSEIGPDLAIRTVHDGLRDDVLPRLEDRHAVATMKAALGILRNVVTQLEGDDGDSRAVVADHLDRVEGWRAALAGSSPEIAAEVGELGREAAELLPTDPRAARERLLRAAQKTIAFVWQAPELRDDERLVASVRAVTRADVDARLRTTR